MHPCPAPRRAQGDGLAASRKRAVGATLLGIVAAKLFLVELTDRGSLYRTVSFIVDGGLMLAVGYFAPIPPARDDEPARDRPLGDPA